MEHWGPFFPMLNPTAAIHADRLDRDDPIAALRDQFYFTDEDFTYFDGNSLGRLPLETLRLSEDLVRRQWGSRLLRGWTDDWMALSTRIGDKIARLLGAQAGEVVVADSTSVVLYKLVVAALQARQGRSRVVTDDMNFPSDLYIIQAAVNLVSPGTEIKMVPSRDDITVPMDDILAQINENTALVVLSHVSFKSSYLYDMRAITQQAHKYGALVLWDVSHSAGALRVDLGECEVDLAVGCSYKYLNGGPGAPAFLYVRKDHQGQLLNPISGWFGHDAPFDFSTGYRPAEDINRFLTGTPPVTSIALIEPGIDMILETGIDQIREKSVKQTDFLISLWDTYLKDLGFALKTPAESAVRGSHVSFGHTDGHRINQALRDHCSIFADFRAPDNLRIGITPLYMSYREIHAAAEALHQIVTGGLHEQYSQNPDEVII
jgi:kynureninase